MDEHIQFVRCDEWLRENGNIKRIINPNDLTITIEYKKNGTDQIEKMTGEDIIRLTIQLYNDVWE